MSESDRVEIPGYQLLETLGQGGMGTVYRARQVALDRSVAIKILPRKLSENPDHIEQFLHEAKSEATLKHPNIVQIYSAGNIGDTYYFVMEYVSGYSVQNWLDRSGKLSESDALLIAESVAQALRYAWDKASIIHGDIKPGNVMVDEDGILKLGDFLALALPGVGGKSGPFEEYVVGTPNYMSPEQLQGESVLDCRADIYALGAVMHHLLSGTVPFEGIKESDRVGEQLVSQLEDIQVLNSSVSTSTTWLLEKMLCRDRSHRHQRWEEVLDDLTRVRKGLPPEGPIPPAGSSAMRRALRRKAPQPLEPRKRSKREPARPVAVSTGGQGTEEEMAPRPWSKVALGAMACLLGIGMSLLAVVFLMPGPPSQRAEDWAGYATRSPESPAPVAGDETLVAGREERPSVAPPKPKPPRPGITAPPKPSTVLAEEPVRAEVAEPPVFPEEPAITDEERAAALKEYVEYLQKTMGYVARRNHRTAEQYVDNWLQRNGDHPYYEAATRERSRLQQIRDLSAALETADALKGLPVSPSDSFSGRIDRIEDGKIFILRGNREIKATVEMNISSLSDEDIVRILKALDPDRYAVNRVILEIALGRSQRAERLLSTERMPPDEGARIRGWIDDWQGALLNMRAYRAIKEIRDLVEEGNTRAAKARLDAALSAYQSSDVFAWAAGPEVARLQQDIQKMKQP